MGSEWVIFACSMSLWDIIVACGGDFTEQHSPFRACTSLPATNVMFAIWRSDMRDEMNVGHPKLVWTNYLELNLSFPLERKIHSVTRLPRRKLLATSGIFFFLITPESSLWGYAISGWIIVEGLGFATIPALECIVRKCCSWPPTKRSYSSFRRSKPKRSEKTCEFYSRL